MSTAGAECVSAPTETNSAPLVGNRVEPLQRHAARHLDLGPAARRAAPPRAAPPSDRLSASTRVAPAASASSSCCEALHLDLDRHLVPGRAHPLERRRHAAGHAHVVVLDQNAVVERRADGWCRRRRERRTSRAARSVGVVLRVSRTRMRPAAASTKRRVMVAMPDRRCRKFRAVRSAVRSGPRQAFDHRRSISPPAHGVAVVVMHGQARPPGRAAGRPRAPRRAPATTQGDLARNTPRAAQSRPGRSPRSSRRPSRGPRPARAGRSRDRAPDRAGRRAATSRRRLPARRAVGAPAPARSPSGRRRQSRARSAG